MSASQLTPTVHLPQFVATDKPTWLGDFNGAMEKIDNAFTDRDASNNTQNLNYNALATQVAAQKAAINTLIARVNVLDTVNPDIPPLP